MTRRRRDNETAPLWIDEGETRIAPLISVAPIAPIDKVYTFTADEETATRIRVGQRVAVPFGRKNTLRPAIVTAIDTGPWTSTLKPVADILDPAGQLSEHLLELGRWISRYYVSPLGRTLAAMVPGAVRRQSGFITTRSVKLIRTDTEQATRLGPKQRAIIETLQRTGAETPTDVLLETCGASRASLRSLIAKGWIVEKVTKRPRQYDGLAGQIEEPEFDLNDDQREAVARVTGALDSEAFRAFVLLGVSGSGKTEVYVRAMRHVLDAGRQAIMLVPEIALTTQLMQRLAARFPCVAAIHSGLSDVERSLAWESIRMGKTPIVIGTRSAVFAPCPNLGLIVVDEEQEPSYKNLRSPRFHVRDVAIKRAHLLGIPIVLGSATPSLETWHNLTTHATYERIDLPQRVLGLSLPDVRLVDMRGDRSPLAGSTISPPLADALRETLDRGEQAVLLLNRRGYATWLFCPRCKTRIQCEQCHSSMVLHQSRNRLLCHHCRLARDIPARCADPSCGAKLVRGGGGTQRIEEQLHELLPDARVRRADSDTMTDAGKYRALVRAVEAQEIDILLGTQMIAKGLDFPNVALVGVIGADLFGATDFRAAERLFQLVTQVAGRAGRAEGRGRVVVQSSSLDQPALRFAASHDFLSFVESEMRLRRRLGFPPYSRLARFVLAGRRDGETAEEAAAFAKRLRDTIDSVRAGIATVLGPHPCFIERIRNAYRHEVLLRTSNATDMLAVLEKARSAGALKTKCRSLVIDVDPVNLA